MLWLTVGALQAIVGVLSFGLGAWYAVDPVIGILATVDGVIALAIAYRLLSSPTRRVFDVSAAWGILSLAFLVVVPAALAGVVVLAILAAIVFGFIGRRQASRSAALESAVSASVGPASSTSAATSYSEMYAGTMWASPPAAETLPAAGTAKSGAGRLGRGAVILGVVVVVLVVVLASTGLIRQSSGGPYPANLPPAGTIWFGSSFDPKTFVLTGRTQTAGTNAPFSFVAQLARSTKGSEMTMRWLWNLSLVTNSALHWEGEGEVWGGSGGPLFEAGEWRLELADVGGNVLASGTLTVQ